MRRYAWWLVFLAGCHQSSGLDTAGGTMPTTSTAVAAPVESSAGTPETVEAASPDDEEILAFAREVQPLAKCQMQPTDPACRDPARIAWLTEHVDWQLREAMMLVMELNDASPNARKAVTEERVRRVDTAQEVEAVVRSAAQFGANIGQSGEPCTSAAGTPEEYRKARRWLKAKPPPELPTAVTAKLDRALIRQDTARTLYVLRCGSRRVLIAREDGPTTRLLPLW